MGAIVGLAMMAAALATGLLVALGAGLLNMLPVSLLTHKLRGSRPAYWRTFLVSFLAIVLGQISGFVLQLAMGGPSWVTGLGSLAIYGSVFSLLLRGLVGEPYRGLAGFNKGVGVGLLSTLLSLALFIAVLGAFRALKALG